MGLDDRELPESPRRRVRPGGSNPGDRCRRSLGRQIDEDTMAVLCELHGQLIEVWFEESDPDEPSEALRVFEAGCLGQAAWMNVYGSEED